MKSQEQAILEYLEAGNAITPMDALHKFGSFRLCARIFELKRAGHNIVTNIIKSNGKRFAEYRLAA